jgi:hypothetical protein
MAGRFWADPVSGRRFAGTSPVHFAVNRLRRKIGSVISA